jgi:hypothetical protein
VQQWASISISIIANLQIEEIFSNDAAEKENKTEGDQESKSNDKDISEYHDAFKLRT